MNYKSVLEEQIETLKKRQEDVNKNSLINAFKGTEETCLITRMIIEAIETARTLPLTKD